ncbi:MAG: AraC family transcriptional regulator [Phycisphaeraceae bacterium]|nr:MAG: AraC family transcriptional regulator [Phycisphaeraceae bacterium]
MPQRHDTAMDYRARMVRVLRRLQEAAGAGEPTPSVEELAKLAHFSRYHFSRLFSSMTGESVAAHTRRLRLERGAGELAGTDRQVLDIALACGFEAHESFARAFKMHFGRTPSEFRAGAREPLDLPAAPNGVRYGPDDAAGRFVPLLRENPMAEVKVETVPARRLAAVRHTGPYHEIGPAFARVFSWAGPRGVLGPTTEAIGIYHDDHMQTQPEDLRADACVTAPPGFGGDADAGVRMVEIPACVCAIGLFKGPHARFAEVYQWFFGTWLPASGHEPADGPCFELYLNNPQQVAPEDCLTAIHIPVAG